MEKLRERVILFGFGVVVLETVENGFEGFATQ